MKLVQIRGPSVKALLPISRDLTPAIDPLPPAVSQLELSPDAIDDEITLNRNQKKQKVRSFSSRGSDKTRPKPESIDDDVQRKLPLGYENKTALIGKAVEAIPGLLWALNYFIRNPSSNSGVGRCFSAADQLYAATVAASYCAHHSHIPTHFVAV